MDRTFTLVLGGARSGKSTHAEHLAAQVGGDVLYIATAEARDSEMRERIAKHRSGRPSSWSTLEASEGIGEKVRGLAEGYDVVLLDCFTMLASKAFELVADPSDAEARLRREVNGLFETFKARVESWLVVSNEVGLGIVPEYPLGRRYRDALGRANQELAKRADVVLLLVAGLPLRIK